MTGPVAIDTNLLLLLVVGSASLAYIGMHRRLAKVSENDFDMLVSAIEPFSEILLIPQVVAEVSNLSAQIGQPAAGAIRETLGRLVESTTEVPVESISAVQRAEFSYLGVTDAALLHLCSTRIGNSVPTLLTVDGRLSAAAYALGCNVQNYRTSRIP